MFCNVITNNATYKVHTANHNQNNQFEYVGVIIKTGIQKQSESLWN